MLYVRFHVKENKLLDDVGVLVSEENMDLFPSMLEEYRKYAKDFNQGTFGRLYVCFYEYSDFYTVIDRNYLKITDAVVQITTLITVLREICLVPLSFFALYSFLLFIS